MIRKVIKIDEEKCIGCGLCAKTCHESAIAIIDGKAKLIREDYCDGLGNCLSGCPVNAISFEDREIVSHHSPTTPTPKQTISISDNTQQNHTSQLLNWPVQLKLVNPQAEYFDNSHLLIAADCTAFAYANFHSEFMENRITLIGCPKLDDVDYSEKITEILTQNKIKSITIVRMEVPCCGGLAQAAVKAWSQAGGYLPLQVCIIKTDGEILEGREY